METVAIGVYVTDLTGKAAWTGAVAAAGFVPTAVLGPIGGALADRWERRKILLTTTCIQTALASLLTTLFVIGRPAALTVTLVVLAGGVAQSIGFPSYQALLPDLVPTEDLAGAIALSSAQWNLGRVIGPALAGVVIGLGSYAWALGINSLSFLAVVMVLLTLRLPMPSGAPTGSIFSSIKEGVRFVRQDQGLRINMMTMALTTFVAAPFIALVPAMALKVLHAGAFGTSVLVTAQGIGAVAVGLSVGPLAARLGARRVLVTALSVLAPALALYAYAPALPLSALAIFFVGGAYLAAIASFTTIAQVRAPGHMRGRVLSVNNVLLGSLYPLGSVVQGALSDSIGLRNTTAIAAAVLGGAIVLTRVVRPGVTAAIDAPVVVPATP
ncbi:MAG: arabinose efflux permease family protein [Actinomycetia bacterium]|nr:arabinose efflux permease family protein [Actinomycetes bacterium]